MPKLTKVAPQLYVTEGGLKYYGTPKNVWFFADRPSLRSAVVSKHSLDYEDEVWNQFAPNGEAFRPLGHREPLVFESETPVRRSLYGKVRPEKNLTIGRIGEDGEGKFGGSIEFHVKAAGGEYDLPPHGTVWLAASDSSLTDTLYLSLYMAEEQIGAIYADLIARPNAILTVRLKFAIYQDEMEASASPLYQTLMLENDAHIPIIEAELAVMDNPHGFEKPVQNADDEAERKPTAPSVLVTPCDNSLVVQRLNWAIGLLVLLVLVMLLK